MRKYQEEMLEKAIVVGVDLDGTLCSSICWDEKACLNVSPKRRMVEKVNELFQSKFIVIYTARRDHLIPATLQWLRKYSVNYHAISNLKTPVDCYIDDLAINVTEFLEYH